MCRRDKVDICGTLFLQIKKNFRKPRRSDFFAGKSERDIMVLTVDTAQRTSGKKYGSGAARPADAWFFPIVQRSARRKQSIRHTAVARFF